MSEAAAIRSTAADGVLIITIDRPDVLNSLDPRAHSALQDAFNAFAADDDLRVAIITGAGSKAFCVGSDLKARAAMGGDDMPETGFAGITERFDLYKPVIAAVNGHAVGGGLEIVLASDIAISVPAAKFGLPEPRVGLAAAGGLHRLVRQLPMKRAMELALTGELLDADGALEVGLINRIVKPEDLMDSALEVAHAILQCAPLSIRATKQMMADGLTRPSLADAFAADYSEHARMLRSEDAAEGSNAFLERRPPQWKGR